MKITFKRLGSFNNNMDLNSLIALAKEKIGLGQSITPISEVLNKIADGGDPGATDVYGNPTSQDYNSMAESGAEYDTSRSPDQGLEHRFGPESDEPDIQVDKYEDDEDQNENDKNPVTASSNKTCVKCGQPTDSCVCMDGGSGTQYNRDGSQSQKTRHDLGKTDNRMDPTQSSEGNRMNPTANQNMVNVMIKLANLSKIASHIEEIEIPFSDLHLDKDVDYNMSGRTQEVNSMVVRYLNTHVYTGPHKRFTVVRIEQSKDKLFVTTLVYDNQLDHVEASTVANGDKLHKVSNIETEKLTKTAWRKRLTVPIGTNDETGLVQCPIEGMYLTRACGTCPLAGNPETYVQDGYVECHFDDMTSWLGQGINAHEHVPYQR